MAPNVRSAVIVATTGVRRFDKVQFRGAGRQGLSTIPRSKTNHTLTAPKPLLTPRLLMGVTLKKYAIMEVSNVRLRLISKTNSAAQGAGYFVSRQGWMSK